MISALHLQLEMLLEAAQLQFKALELVDALFCEVNPIPVKHALNLMGWDMGPLRMPIMRDGRG